MTYNNLVKALKNTGIPFAEDAWEDAGTLRGDYGVYALDGADDLTADDDHAERMAEGTIDLFVQRDPGHRKAATIENALRASGVYWSRYDRDYERETGYTHFVWEFRCLA